MTGEKKSALWGDDVPLTATERKMRDMQGRCYGDVAAWPLGPSAHTYTAAELRGIVPETPLPVIEGMAPTSDPCSLRLYLSRALTPSEESQLFQCFKAAGLMAVVA